MKKSPQDNSPIQSQVEQLEKQIQSCKKFIDGDDLQTSIAIIFNDAKKLPDCLLISHEQFRHLSFPTLKLLEQLVQSIADDLTAKKLLLENGSKYGLNFPLSKDDDTPITKHFL